MSNVKIETLTPVHVGSGNLLNNNMDFFGVEVKDKKYLAIISLDKIWGLLGPQHLDNWLNIIENRKDINEFIRTYAPFAKSKDYSQRRIRLMHTTLLTKDSFKEAIHNGMGLPYIPGSSIKGAIRTAILASMVHNVHEKENKIQKYVREKTKVTAENIEQELFGKDPNSDIFRFFQVGDAYFEKETEIATRVINLNIRDGNDNLMDTSKSQLIEAIGQEVESEFQLKIAKEYYDFAKLRFANLGNLPVENIGDLFRLINAHTKQLVEEEIDDWSKISKSKDGAEDYIEQVQNILEKINACENGKSCVLRIGHASGWRFITGAWTETLDNFKDVVIPASRPNNKNYEEYVFPKSRRLDEESYILGFVKLTVKHGNTSHITNQ